MDLSPRRGLRAGGAASAAETHRAARTLGAVGNHCLPLVPMLADPPHFCVRPIRDHVWGHVTVLCRMPLRDKMVRQRLRCYSIELKSPLSVARTRR